MLTFCKTFGRADILDVLRTTWEIIKEKIILLGYAELVKLFY